MLPTGTHSKDRQGPSGLWCPRGGSGRGCQVTLPARSPCTSNHRAPLAGASAASTGAAKRMQDGGDRAGSAAWHVLAWDARARRGDVPCSHHPCAGGPSDPQENQPSAAGCEPCGVRPRPALPRARSVCRRCFRGSHQAPAEISCSWLGPGTQPFPGSPRLALPHGWHRPATFPGAAGPARRAYTPCTVLGCWGWRGSGMATQSQRLIPDKASQFLTLGQAGNVLRQRPGGTVLASDLRGMLGRSEVMGQGTPWHPPQHPPRHPPQHRGGAVRLSP